MKNIDRVREFHETYGCFVNDKASLDNFDSSLVSQRYTLLSEELSELVVAIFNNDRAEILDALTDLEYLLDGTYLTFGVNFFMRQDIYNAYHDSIEKTGGNHGGLGYIPQFSSRLADMIIGYKRHDIDMVRESINVMSIIINAMFDFHDMKAVRKPAAIEVHQSNMSKLGADGKPLYRADGKILKGPNYFKPNLRDIINE